MGKFNYDELLEETKTSRFRETLHKLNLPKDQRKLFVYTVILAAIISGIYFVFEIDWEKNMENQNEEQVLERLYQETERLEMDAWEAIPIKTPDGDWAIKWKLSVSKLPQINTNEDLAEVEPNYQGEEEDTEQIDVQDSQFEGQGESNKPTYHVTVSSGLGFTDVKK